MRKLTDKEIVILEQQGCQASNWNMVEVADAFATENIRNVRFTGKVQLGAAVVLRNIAELGSTGQTSFAQGLEVSVMKEDGGLEVAIYDGLTAMEAAAAVDPELKQYKANRKFNVYDCSIIEDGAEVCDVRKVCDAYIHSGASVNGALRLQEVSIYGHIQDGVILEHVIVLNGSHVSDGAQMDNCFVGEGCHIGRLFSATQSLFFANCHYENGEACALFAGPYSVSHHKATLMIASQTSFFNAGSGSNQSNHSYKMGPNKFGRILRGAKLGSTSYLYWPAQVGVFSTVVGHHMAHFDLRNMPFSLITESEGNTCFAPGNLLRSVGLRRDIQKWPKRDKRIAVDEAADNRGLKDIINFSLFNPYIVGFVLNGIKDLNEMHENERTEYKGCHISKHHITRGQQFYKQFIDMYLADVLERSSTMGAALHDGVGEWIDLAGFICPKRELIDMLERGIDINDAAKLLNARLPEMEYNWMADQFVDILPDLADISAREALIAKGKKTFESWNAQLDADGARDLAACEI